MQFNRITKTDSHLNFSLAQSAYERSQCWNKGENSNESNFTKYSYIPQIVTKFLAIFPQKVTICGNLTNFYEIVILTRKVTFLIPFENYSTFSVTEHIISHTLRDNFTIKWSFSVLISEWNKQTLEPSVKLKIVIF